MTAHGYVVHTHHCTKDLFRHVYSPLVLDQDRESSFGVYGENTTGFIGDIT